MAFFSALAKGIFTYPRAISFISQHHLWKYIFIAALMSFIVFVGVFSAAIFFITDLHTLISTQINTYFDAAYLQKGATFLSYIVVYGLAFFLFYKSYKYLMLMFLSPILGFIAEKVYYILHPEIKEPDFSISLLLRNILRGIKTSMVNATLEISISLFLVIISLIFPFISLLTAILIVIVESYFVGYSMIDYRNELQALSFSESMQSIWKHKGFAIGNGVVFLGIVLIPILGVLLAPPLAVVAAGIGFYELTEKK